VRRDKDTSRYRPPATRLRLNPSVESVRAETRRRSERYERFSDDELQKMLKDQSLESQHGDIGAELFLRRAERLAPAGPLHSAIAQAEGFTGAKQAVSSRALKRSNRGGRSPKAAAGNTREAFLRAKLEKKGFSLREWARKANVDFHTADNCLKGKTQSRPDTLKNLADALGITVKKLKLLA
jgi:lambda repressor-like predicted transcriptional regulator